MSVDVYNALDPSGPNDPAQNRPLTVKAELRDITETENLYGEVTSSRPTARRLVSTIEASRYADLGLLVRRRLNHAREAQWVQLEIRSPILQRALAEVCGDSFFLNTKVSPIIIRKPYLSLFHYRSQLREYSAHPDRSDEEKVHLKLLIGFMAKNFGRVETEFDRLIPRGQVSWELIWTLFKPDEEVFLRKSHYVECGSVWGLRSTDKDIKVETRSWDYDGSHFGPVESETALEPFEGICDITSLPIYPVRFHKDGLNGNLRQELIDRGREWRSIVDVTHCSYDGLAWTSPGVDTSLSPYSPPIPPGDQRKHPNLDNLVPIHVFGRIILDYSTHQQANPDQATKLAWSAAEQGVERRDGDELDGEEPDSKDQDGTTKLSNHFKKFRNDSSFIMSDEQALLCPARVRGFSLADKKWAFFLVERTSPIKWLSNPMDKLEIDSKSKRVINALVTEHGSRDKYTNARFKDVVVGKGTGLAFLLAGAPGLGKTLTAEVVAEHQKKPLYAITSGELGTDTRSADYSLRKVFDRARAWNAYLLLDEADVFLAERNHDDLARNGLVTVFLRLIEYYEGVIFLTTNRLTAFDPAFESRIQFKLFYDPLTPNQRTKIWKTLLPPPVSSPDSTGVQEWDENFLLSLGVNHDINGREIKNMIKVAVALANIDGVPLAEEHLEIVKRMNEDWSEKAKGKHHDSEII